MTISNIIDWKDMKKEKVLLTIGIIILAIGVILNFINFGGNSVSIAQQINNPQEAVLAISANNKSAVLLNAISMFFIGCGGLLIAITALKFLKKK